MSVRGIIRRLGMVLAIFCLCLAFAPSQKVEAVTVTTVCTSEVIATHQEVDYPHTDGIHVTWQARGPDHHTDVYLHNIATGTTTNISANVADYNSPAEVNGNYVVWVGEGDIFLHDILAGTTTNLSNNPGGYTYQDAPVIDGHYVAWTGVPEAYAKTDIFLHNINTSTTINVSNSPDTGEIYPQIAGRYMIWIYHDEDSHEVYLYDLVEGTGRTISGSSERSNYPARIDGQYVVWTGEEWHGDQFIDTEIYLYDIVTQTEKNISQIAASPDYDPKISRNLVTWRNDTGEYDFDAHTYLYNLTTDTKKSIANFTDFNLHIDGARVVGDGAWLYDDQSGMLQVLAHNLDDMSASYGAYISGDTVVWASRSYFPSIGRIYLSICQNGEPPVITDQPASVTIHPDETVTLSVAATGDGSLTYQWYTGNAGDTSNPIPGATFSSYTTPFLTENVSYWVRVTGTFGSADSTTAIISVQQTLPPTEVTPSPTTETPVPTTETPLTEVTPSPTTETPVPTTEVPPTATTVPPTATTAPTINLLMNGGFEVDADGDKLPDGWTGKKTATANPDKIKCDKADKKFAHSAPCAFMFKGNGDGSTSKLSQKVNDTSAFVHDSQVSLSAWVDRRSAPVGTRFAQVKIAYSDGSKDKLKLNIPVSEGYIQQTDSVLLDLTGKTVKSVKVDLRHDSPKGKFFVDDVALTVEAETLIRLP